MTDNAVMADAPLDGSSGAFFSQIAPQLRSQGIEALLPSGVTFEAFTRAAATAIRASRPLPCVSTRMASQPAAASQSAVRACSLFKIASGGVSPGR